MKSKPCEPHPELAELLAETRLCAQSKNFMTKFDLLSPLEQEKVSGIAESALDDIFAAMHIATGWCGDHDERNRNAALPALKEAIAKFIK